MHKIEISNKCSFKPLSRKDKNNDDIIDIGLAHGIAGYSYFLKKAIHRNINKEKAQSLLKRCYKIFELVEQDYRIYGSYYPYTVTFNNLKGKIELSPHQSRLAWCYGDLGILYILFNNNYKKGKYLSMLLDLTTRYDGNNTKITDQGFCHGSSGVAYMYWKLYLQTKNIRFLKAADFWIRQIILENKEKKILNDYKFLVGNFDQRGLQPYNHLLEGSIGLALVLNSYLHPEIEPTWDRCLLLS
jgi:lantibiotic modifying enzyme